MRRSKFEHLRRRVMAAAQTYGCEADVQLADDAASNTSLGIKIVVVRRSPAGVLHTREDNLTLARNCDVVPIVMRAVRESAVFLSANPLTKSA